VSDRQTPASAGDRAVLRIPATLEELSTVRRFIRERAHRMGADPKVVHDLVQAVDESVANTILHGYRGRSGTVEVELGRSGESLVARLRDQAPAFDPTKLPDPDITLPLDKRPLGGMGVFLTRELMDEVSYRQIDKGNELTLVKHCRRASGGETC
jgi:serine/threonine-protein kinase RsbW